MALKQLPDDFREFLSFLNKNQVRYLLLGGWAVGIYGYPRATGDMDILIAVDDANLTSLLTALCQFGAPSISKKHFKEEGNVFRMGRSPIKIEILTNASGIEFEDCYSRRQIITVDDIIISLISREDLIQNKKKAARPQDLADVARLTNMDQ
jgi:hypothetical protein